MFSAPRGAAKGKGIVGVKGDFAAWVESAGWHLKDEAMHGGFFHTVSYL